MGDLAVIQVEGYKQMSRDYIKLPPERYYPNGKIPVLWTIVYTDVQISLKTL